MNRYDPLNRRTDITDARSKITLFEYNGREDLTKVTDPRSLVTRYSRNGLGDTNSLISPDTGVASHTYDAAGNLKTRTDSRGVLATYGHDALNRLASVTYTQSGQENQVFVWNYDQTGPGFSYGIGRLTSTQFPQGSATFAYDPQGRLASTAQTVVNEGPLTLRTGYGYDAAGRITSITYPSGRVLFVQHSGGVPVALSLAPDAGSAAVPLINALQLEPAPGGLGTPRSWLWQLDSGTLVHSRVFDAYGRMVRYPLGGAVRDISYDAADRINGYIHWDANTGAAVTALNQTFGYNELGRATSIATGVGNWSIGYDDSGNRTVTTYTANSGALTRNYSTASDSNRLLALDNPARVLSQDAAGNTYADVQGAVGWATTYDLSGRVSALTSSPDGFNAYTTLYAHDAFGQRVLKRPTGATCLVQSRAACNERTQYRAPAIYVYDQEGHLLGEYRPDRGGVIREYVWLQGMPVAIIDGNPAAPAIYYIQADHLDTPRVVLDRAGRQRWSWLAEPFGNSAPVDNPLGFGAFSLNLRMPGQYFDTESGLSYNYFRNYDSGVGRFTQSDPIGLAGGINTYSYVGSAPTMYTDPSGLFLPALAIPFVGGTTIGLGEIGVGLGLGALMMVPGDTSPGDRAQQAQERKAYSRVCKSPVPPTGDRCKDAKANLDRLKQCLQMREAFSKKWFNDQDPGHLTEITNTKQAIRKLEEFLRSSCPAEYCP